MSFFFQAEDGIRDLTVTGVQTCALPISARAGPERDPPRGVRALRRPPHPAARGARRRGGALHVTPVARAAGLDARPVAERAALGAGRSAALPHRAADGAASGGARPRGPPHLRALVPAARAALAAPPPRRRARATRPPAAAGSPIHRRRRGATARLCPDQNTAAARPPL